MAFTLVLVAFTPLFTARIPFAVSPTIPSSSLALFKRAFPALFKAFFPKEPLSSLSFFSKESAPKLVLLVSLLSILFCKFLPLVLFILLLISDLSVLFTNVLLCKGKEPTLFCEFKFSLLIKFFSLSSIIYLLTIILHQNQMSLVLLESLLH